MPQPANLVHQTSTTTGTKMQNLITAERLRELLCYDSKTGECIWVKTRVRGNRAVAGKRAGTKHNAGYWQIGIEGRIYLRHRLAWLYMTGGWPDGEVDHRDTDRSNDKWHNLRIATHSQNQSNVRLQKNNKSGYKGVSFSKRQKKWVAQITINGKQTNLGFYSTPIEAYSVYCEAACKHKREFARVA